MSVTDIIWIGLIAGGALYLLYRCVFKKGGCSGCDDETCETKGQD